MFAVGMSWGAAEGWRGRGGVGISAAGGGALFMMASMLVLLLLLLLLLLLMVLLLLMEERGVSGRWTPLEAARTGLAGAT